MFNLELLNEGFRFDESESWNIGVSLFVGPFLVNQQLEMVEMDYFSMIDYHCLKNLKHLEKNRYKIVKNGVDYYFKRTSNNRYNINKIVLFIFLENSENSMIKKLPNNENENFFDVISKTKKGANYLLKKGIIDEIREKLETIKDMDELKLNILNIGNIAQNEEGVKIIQNNTKLLNLLLSDFLKQKYSLSLKGVILHIAHMFVKSNTGRKLLSDYKWEVNFICKKRISDNDDQYIAFPIIKRNETKQFIDKTEPQKNWSLFNEILTKVTVKYQDGKSVQKKFIDFLSELSKNKANENKNKVKEKIVHFKEFISENIDLFFYMISQLSYYLLNRTYRKRLWTILDCFFYTNNFLLLLDNLEGVYEQFLIEI